VEGWEGPYGLPVLGNALSYVCMYLSMPCTKPPKAKARALDLLVTGWQQLRYSSVLPALCLALMVPSQASHPAGSRAVP